MPIALETDPNSGAKQTESNTNDSMPDFVRMRDLPKRYNISHATACRWIKNRKLPEPKRISHNCVGWNKAVLDAVFFDTN
jgi:predicted DNA-binding transcriptional regulator AlpA